MARELTKYFESIQTDTLIQLYENFKTNPEIQQGEFVIIIPEMMKFQKTLTMLQ